MWIAVWHLFFKHIPVLANLKAVLLGERRLPPRAKKHAVVFKAPQSAQKSSAPAATSSTGVGFATTSR
jgi:hypothetical protein